MTKVKLLLITVILLLSCSAKAHALAKVYVGGYAFAPYVEESIVGYTGLTLDIIEVLNAMQNEFEFKFVPTSIEKRHQAFALGRFDMLLFENPQWGWSEADVSFTPINIKDGERYIALKERAMGSGYFEQLEKKNILLVRGYHYPLLKDQNKNKNIKIQYVSSTKALIDNILKKRGDIAPVTDSYLRYFLAKFPEKKRHLQISPQWEQHYHHNIVLRNLSPLSQQKLQSLIDRLTESGELSRLANRYGLSVNQEIND